LNLKPLPFGDAQFSGLRMVLGVQLDAMLQYMLSKSNKAVFVLFKSVSRQLSRPMGS
jgi:hypothetical protein